MALESSMEARMDRLSKAFSDDGFLVERSEAISFRGRLGLVAHHRTAANYETGEPKRAYYVEGSPYEMGYLMGRLAEPQIDAMTEVFIDRVVRAMVRESIRGQRLDFTGTKGPKIFRIHRLLIDVMHEMIRSQGVRGAIPVSFHQEIRGLVAGCRDAASFEGRSTSVTEEELWVLNAGLDCVLARAYTGELLRARIPTIAPKDLWIPIACNGFALLNDAVEDGPLFGRDYMFPTGGIFHRAAALVIGNPDPARSEGAVPWVSMTAPGMVGSIAAMNLHGVAAGVDVSAGANCTPSRPGFNSLLLVRHCIEHSTGVEHAVDRIVEAERGVTWNYIVAGHGAAVDRACVVEAGASMPSVAFADYPGPALRSCLPSPAFVASHPTLEPRNGAMPRWDDYHLPSEYLEGFNPRLFQRFNKTLRHGALSPKGRINRMPSEHNCPGSFYFAPVRGRKRQVILTTNHFVVPEMRLAAMHPWTQRVSRSRMNDSQWRYDELNCRILESLDREGTITYERAKEILDFLAPTGDFPDYYRLNPKSSDGRETVVFGSTSLFYLKARSVESHFGFYGDEWIKLHLPQYVENTHSV